MPDEITDPYRVAAEAWATSKARLWGLDEPARTDVLAAILDEHLRAAVDAVRPLFEAAGREAAAQALIADAGRLGGWHVTPVALRLAVKIARGETRD